MSGRLTILPKKSYCPWNQDNVERVLRDERLERERLEKEAKANINQRRRKGEDDKSLTADGHVNLFPEAKEAELNLARGHHGAPSSKADGNNKEAGIMPVPLGGDEATKRKMGAPVPFYMRTPKQQQGQNEQQSKYSNTSRIHGLGNRGAPPPADAITSKIMADQYDKREDSRKIKMDPMSQFFVGGTLDRPVRTIMPAIDTRKSNPPISSAGQNDGVDETRDRHDNEGKQHKQRRRKKSRRSYHTESDCTSSSHSDNSVSSSSSSTTEDDKDSTTSDKERSRHRKRSRHSRKHTSKHHRSSTRSKERRSHRRTRSKSKHSKQSKKKRRSRDRSLSNDSNSNKDRDNANDELEELRKRRRVRESREMERGKHLLAPPPEGNTLSEVHHPGMEGRYNDQFNPRLSRN